MSSSASSATTLSNPDHEKPKPKSKRKKSATGTRKSRGWGPFQSVLKERSVDFNLTLDVQNLQQEIQDLTTLRDVLSTRTTLRRHSPEGSFFHVVQEYLQVFRTGWAILETGRKRLLREQDQRAFLHSVMDPELDVGNGLRGPDVMAEQIILYSTLIKFVNVRLTSYDIVVAEDSVIIRTQAKLRFQVLRKTIESIFPHVIGDECLVAQLVGQEVEPSIGITFSFNEQGKCCKYEFEVDFVEAFAGIVKDPTKLDTLLGRALIADNCMLGLIDEPLEVPRRSWTVGNALEDERVEEVNEMLNESSIADGLRLDLHAPQLSTWCDEHDRFDRIVDDYYHAFAKGYQPQDQQKRSQADFIAQAFVSGSAQDPQDGGRYVFKRWQALSECFGVLDFRQTCSVPVQYDAENLCAISSTASYTLRITPNTLESVFPHVLQYRQLVDTLVGNALIVPSQLVFSIERDTGRISHIVERMDFVAAMAPLVRSQEELSIVMSQALLPFDGMSCHSLKSIHQEETCENSKDETTSEKHAANLRTMNLADILTTDT